MAKLEVQIGADSSELSAEISAAEAKIERLRKQKAVQVKLGMDTSALTKSINESKTQLANLKKSLDNTGSSFSGMTPKVANGGNALMQFSRIAQDAPYGIIGIGNNLTATAEAFGHLSKQSGGAGNALKAVASSLMGTGGLLLVISLVTTGLTLLAQSGMSIGDVFDKLSGKFDKYKQSLSEANAEAIKSASEQKAVAGAYVAAASNINLSMQDRLLAVKKLQDEYPAYFGNLTKEQILNGDVAGAVKELTKALIAKAKASAYSSKIADLAVAEFKLREEESALIEKIRKQHNEVAIAKATAATAGNQAAGATNIAYADAIDVLQSQRSELKDVQSQIRNNALEQGKWTSEINKSTAASLKLGASTPKVTAPKPANVTPQVSGIGMSIQSQGLVETSGKILQIAKDVQGAEGVIKTSMTGINVMFDTSSLWMLESLQAFNDQANELIAGSIADTFGQLGTAIGEALANGGNVLGAIGSTILQSLGKFLSDMGGMLIQYGTMAILKGKLDLAILTGGPAAIVAGIAAVGVGIALKAIGGAIGAKATGGASSGSSSPQTGASYSSPASSSSGSSSTFSGGNVVFEISGTSLIGVLSNSLDKNKRLGGSLGIV